MNAIDKIRADYDAVPYDSFSFPQTSPVHLRAVASLFGLDAPSPETSRILELGCASGGNIIPLAIRYPKSTIVGVDLSTVQIEKGQRLVAQLKLKNIELRHGDLTLLGAELGTFDYIICHGVYSWVPAEVQAAIMRLCRDNLSPEGIAYISYNTYPGWKTKEIVRDAMILRGSTPDAAENPLGFARGMIDFLADVAPKGSMLEHVMQEHKAVTGGSGDSYLMHEYLEDFNEPVYFLEFLKRASAFGLGYLADAEPEFMFASNYAPKVSAPLLQEVGDSQTRMEQYLDFVSNRTFRRTLLVHADRTPGIRYRLDRERIRALHHAAFLPPRAPLVSDDATPAEYGADDQPPIVLKSGVAKAVAKVLTDAWPETVSFSEILEKLSAVPGSGESSPEALGNEVTDMLQVLDISGNARISVEPVRSEHRGVAGRPCLPQVWRDYADATGKDGTPHVVGLWHEPVCLSVVEQHLIGSFTGSAGADELAEVLVAGVRKGSFSFVADGVTVTDEAKIAAHARDHADQAIRTFSQRFAI